MHYPVHKSDTGSFQELAHKSDVKFGQLSVLTINPGCERGGHYHTRKTEWFCCLSGKCWLDLSSALTQSNEVHRYYLSGDKKEFFAIDPLWSHKVTNAEDTECVVLIICDEEFDPEDPDTFRTEDTP